MRFGTYSISLIVVAFMLLYFGLYLVFGVIPQRLKGGAYESARKFMGGAFVMLAIANLVFVVTGVYYVPPHYKVAINMGCYYVVAKLFALSFITLIGEKPEMSRLRQKITFALVLIFPVCAFLSSLIGRPNNVIYVHIAMGLFLFVSILMDIIYFFRRYNKILGSEEYNDIDEASVHINWMSRSIYLIIVVSFISVYTSLFSSVTPKFVLLLLNLYYGAVCIYTFNKFLNFMVYASDFEQKNIAEFDESTAVDNSVDMNKIRFSAEAYEIIHTRMLEWEATKEYCKTRTTILTTANYVSTNRLYLSNYINTTYKCSFKVRLSKLRIDEAKRILSKTPEATITSIAAQVGFQSLASFTHAFKNIEGVSPKDWLKLQN